MTYKTLFRLLISAGISQLLPGHSVQAQQKWEVKSIPVTTPWTSKVDPVKPLDAYPRPQLERKNWTNLNGLWDYAITDSAASVMPEKTDGKILVPYPIESALSGVQRSLNPDQSLWYKRAFSHANTPGTKTILHFGAVDQMTSIYLNGKLIGENHGGFNRFSFDITPFLKNENNQLMVKVLDATDAGNYPKGKQTLRPSGMYYTATSGIWQTVWLENVPEQYISDVLISPDIDSKEVMVTVRSESDLPVTLQTAGRTVSGKANQPIRLPVANMRLWTTDDPFLYDLKVTLGNDQVKSYFGMRKISIMKDDRGMVRIALNNKPFYNLALLDQGFWPDGLYTAPTDEALAFDIKAAKAMGFNTIRKHIKVEPERWYYDCDRFGMLVWQDMVNPPTDAPEARSAFEKHTKQTIAQLGNHPSIVSWVIFNEGWGAYDQARITAWVKTLDKTRIINGHTGENFYKGSPADSLAKWPNSDVTDIHAYPQPALPPQQQGKAMVLGEFGGVSAFAIGHQWNDTGGWGYIKVDMDSLSNVYSAMTTELLNFKNRGLAGSVYTQPFDVESEQNGLITYDRRLIKIPLGKIAGINSAITGNSRRYYPDILSSAAASEAKLYVQVREQYQQGRKDSLSLRQLGGMAFRNNDTVLYRKVTVDYLKLIRNPSLSENLRFLGRLTSSMADPAFDVLIANPDHLVADPSLDQLLEKLKQIISDKEIMHKPKEVNSLQEWDAFRRSITDKYGMFVDEMVVRMQVAIFQGQHRWAEMASIAAPYFKKFSMNISPMFLNGVAWDVFLHLDDQQALRNALEWSEVAVKREPTPEYVDTYANLLYKLGETKKAIEWEERAVKAVPDNKDLSKALEMMKKGEKTWVR